jgi:hypothetical protein
MPQRKFANQKALIDYAEQNGLVYVWAWIECQRVISPAFTKRKRLLSPDQYEIGLVVCGRQCCFQRRSCKRSLRPTLRYARSWRSNESACERSGRRSKGQHEKRGGLWGRKPPRRRHDSSCCRNLSPRCQQQMHSNPSQPRSAISVNPQAEAIFWTTELTILSDKDRSRAGLPL